MGNRRWAGLIGRHHQLVRRELRRFGGREHDTAGDGFFATFDRPIDAIRCAVAITQAVRSLGIEIRAGVTFGELELESGKPSGLVVNTAARVMSVAGPGEVLVPASVRDIVSGAGITFEGHGTHQLKGIEDEARLFRVTAVDGEPVATPLETGRSRGAPCRDRSGSEPDGTMGGAGCRSHRDDRRRDDRPASGRRDRAVSSDLPRRAGPDGRHRTTTDRRRATEPDRVASGHGQNDGRRRGGGVGRRPRVRGGNAPARGSGTRRDAGPDPDRTARDHRLDGFGLRCPVVRRARPARPGQRLDGRARSGAADPDSDRTGRGHGVPRRRSRPSMDREG